MDLTEILPPPPEPQARIGTGLLEVSREVLDELNRHPLFPNGRLEEDESRPGFAVEVLGLEDRLQLLRELADLRRPACPELEEGQVERGRGRVIAITLL